MTQQDINNLYQNFQTAADSASSNINVQTIFTDQNQIKIKNNILSRDDLQQIVDKYNSGTSGSGSGGIGTNTWGEGYTTFDELHGGKNHVIGDSLKNWDNYYKDLYFKKWVTFVEDNKHITDFEQYKQAWEKYSGVDLDSYEDKSHKHNADGSVSTGGTGSGSGSTNNWSNIDTFDEIHGGYKEHVKEYWHKNGNYYSDLYSNKWIPFAEQNKHITDFEQYKQAWEKYSGVDLDSYINKSHKHNADGSVSTDTDTIIYINSDNNKYQAFLQEDGHKWIMLQRDSCGICRASKPIFKEFVEKVQKEGNPMNIKFAQANIDDVRWSMSGVSGCGLPITVLMENKEVVDNFHGYYQNVEYLEQKTEAFCDDNSCSTDTDTGGTPYQYQTEFASPLEFYTYWNSDDTREKIIHNFKVKYEVGDNFQGFKDIDQATYDRYLADKDFGNQNRDTGDLDRKTANLQDTMEWMQLGNVKYIEISRDDKALHSKTNKYLNEVTNYDNDDIKFSYKSNPKAHEFDYDDYADVLQIPKQEQFPALNRIPLNYVKCFDGSNIAGVSSVNGLAGHATTNTPVSGDNFCLGYGYNFFNDNGNNSFSTLCHERAHNIDYLIHNGLQKTSLELIADDSVLSNLYQFRDEYKTLFTDRSAVGKGYGFCRSYAEKNRFEDFASHIGYYIAYNEKFYNDAQKELKQGHDLLMSKYNFCKDLMETDPGVIRILDDPDAFAAKMSELNLL